jgi:hypothetical protein
VKVFILATCRKPELIRATTLVFDTIRVGFPTAEIEVAWNGLEPSREMEITKEAVTKVAASFVPIFYTPHHEWVSRIIHHEEEPVWICDTDVVFWDSMEQFDFSRGQLTGRYTPKFRCKFANAITQPRLHTCLLRIDTGLVKTMVSIYGDRFPDCYATPVPTLEDLIFPRYIPNWNSSPYFYDTASLLYQVVSGLSFTPEQLEAFDHLGSATLSDLVAPHYPEYRMRETQFAILENPQLAKGSWKMQDEFYKKHAC